MTFHPDTHPMTAPLARCLRPAVERVKRRLAGEAGFTLVELMIVLLTIGILMTVAVPTFLSFKDRAAKSAARQQVSQAIRAVQAYKADNFPGSRNDPDTDNSNTGWHGIRLDYLAKYDASLVAATGIIIDPSGWNGDATSTTDFCLTATVGRWVAAQHGPDTPIFVGTLFTPATCAVSGS